VTTSLSLRLRPPHLDDETEFVAAHKAMADEGFTFGLGYEATVIERCGGVFDSLSTAEDGHPVRRYWID